MLNITKVDHIGIRVKNPQRSKAFYSLLGFETKSDTGFEKGHPIIMQHPSSIVLNLLGPATEPDGPNIVMDVDKKYPGYTHMALKVDSVEDAEVFFKQKDIEITGNITFRDLRSIFVRDPDNNVIEFTSYPGQEPETRVH